MSVAGNSKDVHHKKTMACYYGRKTGASLVKSSTGFYLIVFIKLTPLVMDLYSHMLLPKIKELVSISQVFKWRV